MFEPVQLEDEKEVSRSNLRNAMPVPAEAGWNEVLHRHM